MNETDNLSFFCPPGTVPIGIAASSSCFAITNFQVGLINASQIWRCKPNSKLHNQICQDVANFKHTWGILLQSSRKFGTFALNDCNAASQNFALQVVCSEPIKIESQSNGGQIKGIPLGIIDQLLVICMIQQASSSLSHLCTSFKASFKRPSLQSCDFYLCKPRWVAYANWRICLVVVWLSFLIDHSVWREWAAGNVSVAKFILIVAVVAMALLPAGYATRWAHSNVNLPRLWRPWTSQVLSLLCRHFVIATHED